jgi:hypothetical protein
MILHLVAQLDIDRGQIAMPKGAVGGLHASRIQDAADHLSLAERLGTRDFEYSLENVDVKKKIHDVEVAIKCDMGHVGVVQARVEVIETEMEMVRDSIVAGETRDGKMVKYLEMLDADRLAEGQSIVQSFRHMFTDLYETTAHFA